MLFFLYVYKTVIKMEGIKSEPNPLKLQSPNLYYIFLLISILMLRNDMAPSDFYQLQTNALVENSDQFTACFKEVVWVPLDNIVILSII